MLEFFFQVLLQGLLVAHQATAVLGDCCPVKQVQGQNQVMVDIFSFIGIPSQEPLKYALPHNLNHWFQAWDLCREHISLCPPVRILGFLTNVEGDIDDTRWPYVLNTPTFKKTKQMRMKGLRLTDQGQLQLCQRRPSRSRKAFLLQVRQERDIGCEMPTGFRFCSATFDRGSIERYSLIGEIEAHLTLMSQWSWDIKNTCSVIFEPEWDWRGRTVAYFSRISSPRRQSFKFL